MVNIRKRGKVYQYQFEIAKVDGKRKYISKSGFKTKNEALIAGMKAYDEYINGGTTKESQMSYADYLDYWMKEYFEINFKYSTAKRYKETFEVLKKEIGKYKLIEVIELFIEFLEFYRYTESFYTELSYKICKEENDTTLNANLIQLEKIKTQGRKFLNLFFNGKDSYFSRAADKSGDREKFLNSSVEDSSDFEKHLYTQDEIDKILTRFKDDDVFTCAFITSCFTGMRPGELCALTWEDIDFENKVINVKHSVFDKKKNEKGRWYIGTTKTKSAER